MKEIIPWTCHICHSEFSYEYGGVCARCSKATCEDDLRIIKLVKNDATENSQFVCVGCVKPGEDAIIFSKSKLMRILRKL